MFVYSRDQFKLVSKDCLSRFQNEIEYGVTDQESRIKIKEWNKWMFYHVDKPFFFFFFFLNDQGKMETHKSLFFF